MKLLYIEDNKSLIASLRDFLGRRYVMDVAQAGESGITLAITGHYDVIILDLSLPDMSGRQVCLTLRKAQIMTPILILSGNAEIDSKVALLQAGADDYVSKPFSAGELQARLLALLRRVHLDSQASPVFKVDGLVLDPIARKVERAGRTIELRRKEFDILEYLMRNQDRVVTRSMIMDNVWEEDSETWENTLAVHVKHLRDKIDRPFGQKLVKTVYGLGYTITSITRK